MTIQLYFYFVYPFLKVLLYLASPFVPKIRQGLQERKHGKPWLATAQGQQPIIVHCSSGEFEYAKPVLREIKKLNPQQKVFVSYFSPSYQKSIQSTPEVDFAFPAPWDSQQTVLEFLNYHRPKAYLIARTDVWPGITSQCQALNIPTVLFSATLASTSKRMKSPLSRWVASHTLKFISQIFCVSEEDKLNFQKLGYKGQLEVHGDTRFDQVIFRIQNSKKLKEKLKPLDKMKTLTCGSTWPEDEAVLLNVFQTFKNQMQFIIAPHEPSQNHIETLKRQLTEKKLSFELYSESDSFNSDVLIIDQIGILADLYQWGAYAFVGGSFRKTIHSVMEPLASGCVTFFGPLHHNNREALLFKSFKSRSNVPFAYSISNAQEFCRNLNGFIKYDIDPTALSHEIKQAVISCSGSSHDLAKRIKEI